MKKLWHSKTFLLALIQAVIGILIVALTELELVGYIAIVKSVGDIILRLYTTEPVTT